jgi:hypothetical protein
LFRNPMWRGGSAPPILGWVVFQGLWSCSIFLHFLGGNGLRSPWLYHHFIVLIFLHATYPQNPFCFPHGFSPHPHLERGENILFRGMQSHKKWMNKTTKKKEATKGKESMLVRNNNSNEEMTLPKRFGG